MKEKEPAGRREGRGPRFTSDEIVPGLIQAAVDLLAEKGVEALSFRAVAERFGEKLSHTAPLYHFGTFTGLLGAIAVYGMNELRDRLAEAMESDTEADPLTRTSRAYVAFALARPHLYRAMHDARLWQAVTALGASGAHTERSMATTASWVGQAEYAREAAFAQVVNAVFKSQQSGAVRKGPARTIALSVTALVDGFMFHVLHEQIYPDFDIGQKRRQFDGLLEVLMEGARPTKHQ